MGRFFGWTLNKAGKTPRKSGVQIFDYVDETEEEELLN
jgi:hypothetical protein